VDGIPRARPHGRESVELVLGHDDLGPTEQRSRRPRANGLCADAWYQFLRHLGDVLGPAEGRDAGFDRAHHWDLVQGAWKPRQSGPGDESCGPVADDVAARGQIAERTDT